MENALIFLGACPCGIAPVANPSSQCQCHLSTNVIDSRKSESKYLRITDKSDLTNHYGSKVMALLR